MKKFGVEFKLAPPGGPKVGAIGPFFGFFLKKPKYFFLIVTYNDKKHPVSMPKGHSQYI